jgi:hypothetical protein
MGYEGTRGGGAGAARIVNGELAHREREGTAYFRNGETLLLVAEGVDGAFARGVGCCY